MTKKNLIIIDSCIENIKNITNILKPFDSVWNTSNLCSAKQCLEIIVNGNCPDVFIIGMKLRDMTGLQLTERVRNYSDVPIMLLSEDKEIYTLVKAFDLGVNEYVTLPINNNIFIARLKALIRRAEWDIQYKERGSLIIKQ